jgi:hypothetical protein
MTGSLKSKMPGQKIATNYDQHFLVKCTFLDREGSIEVGREGDRQIFLR